MLPGAFLLVFSWLEAEETDVKWYPLIGCSFPHPGLLEYEEETGPLMHQRLAALILTYPVNLQRNIRIGPNLGSRLLGSASHSHS